MQTPPAKIMPPKIHGWRCSHENVICLWHYLLGKNGSDPVNKIKILSELRPPSELRIVSILYKLSWIVKMNVQP